MHIERPEFTETGWGIVKAGAFAIGIAGLVRLALKINGGCPTESVSGGWKELDYTAEVVNLDDFRSDKLLNQAVPFEDIQLAVSLEVFERILVLDDIHSPDLRHISPPVN
ncbi:MAG: hypothetical protein WCJ24_01650 [Candidatus Saccharibacteria bacterium]